MNRSTINALGAAALLLLLMRRKEGGQESSAGTTAPGVSFPPVVPIGGGQVSQPERGGLGGLISRGIDYMAKLARGLRNKNPLNILYVASNAWVGQVGTDGKYAKFSDVKYGVRAGGKILDSYQRNGFKTVRQIIERWAPANENDVASYLAHVLQETGWTAGFTPARTHYPDLVAAMIEHENGSNPFTKLQLRDWLALP